MFQLEALRAPFRAGLDMALPRIWHAQNLIASGRHEEQLHMCTAVPS